MIHPLKFFNRLLDHYRRSRKKIGVFLVNYNMPERTNALVENLQTNSKWPIDIYVIDNGSDIKEPSPFTNIHVKKNIQTCNGWLEGLKAAKQSKKNYFAYMFLITSASFVTNDDPITPMANFLLENKNSVGIHPALTKDSTTYWTHLLSRDGNIPRKTWMIDNIASMYKADWFDKIGWFDPRMTYAWGIDLETCYIARKENRSIWIDERIKIKKITNIAYKMNRMNMSANKRVDLASKNMRSILKEKYGKFYWKKMTKDYVTEDMI